MTENEIIEILQTEKACVTRAMKNECNRDCYNCDLCEEGKDILTVYDAVIKAFEEVEQYRAIGTVEEIQLIFSLCKDLERIVNKYEAIGTIEDFKALKEKNEPKKIRRTYGTWSGDNYFKFPNNAVVYQCIECYSTVRVGENYCCNCGSCIDWSE